MNSWACERVAASVSSKLSRALEASTPKSRHRTDAVGKRCEHRRPNVSAEDVRNCRPRVHVNALLAAERYQNLALTSGAARGRRVQLTRHQALA